MSTEQPTTRSTSLIEHARTVTPGGVNSPVRAFRAVGGTPRFIRSAQGPWLTDVDGNRYVDLICSWGPMILGHAHPDVLGAVTEAAQRGFSFGTPSENEVALASEIVARTPVDQVRLVSSGTEATMSALRLARGATGRSKVVKFAGCYHGHVDALLASAGSGLATFALPDSAGVPESAAGETIVLPYNDLAAVEQAFAEHGEQIACVVTEACPGNMGIVPPVPGFEEGLREVTRRHGALLISDEVMTGFRCSASGWYGAADSAGIEPDLMTFGKVMGGGFPAAAFGGRADLMMQLAPDGPVYQAGTLSGNPVATAAGLATLQGCTPEVYDRLDAVARTIADAASSALSDAGVPHVVQWAGSMFSVFFRAEPVTSYAAAGAQDTAAYGRFFTAMLEQGVHLPPSAFEAWFVSASHDEGAVERVLTALPRAAAAAAGTWAVRERSGSDGTLDRMASRPARTSVHVLRHGEVDNPDRVLYGCLPDFHLSALGRDMAGVVADYLAAFPIAHLISSPLERAQETIAPLADRLGLEVALDGRVIEAGNSFEGTTVGSNPLQLAHPRYWRRLVNPWRPSWGEPYTDIVRRMAAAIRDARDAAAGREAVIVSHQLPIWTIRQAAEGQRLAHDPRRRQCSLASVTTFVFAGEDLDAIEYAEPAAHLLPAATKVSGA